MNRNIICIMILAQTVCLTACANDEAVYLKQEETVLESTEITTPDNKKEPAFCCVYVCGAVVSPGVYRLTEGTRVCDAIEMAGGFLPEAATEAVNLARELTDAEQIRIPTVEELEEAAAVSEMQAGSTIIQGDSSGKVNLNTAGIEELMTIPGIGEAKANDIIAYRTEHGNFADVRDIMNIAGIKEGIFEKIKDSITVN